MLASDLDYILPEGLIAQEPPAQRDGGRLLVVAEPFEHSTISELVERVPAGALVVFNDTRVMRARLFGSREPSGAKAEVLLLNPVDPTDTRGAWQALLRCNRRLSDGDTVRVGDAVIEVGPAQSDGSRLISCEQSLLDLCEREGHVPLPPYVKRPDTSSDVERYQTVFSRQLGSAAAPTAGLHFTDAALARMRTRGLSIEYVTLHVGAGTFRPVTTERLDDHPMHVERYHVSEQLAERVSLAREHNQPVVAVGTTVVRALESGASADGRLRPGWASTNLLIQPGYQFKVVDSLLTNFHAPKSTLLALVYAFGGTTLLKRAYAEAISHQYRFLSYGDAMWIPRHCR